MIYDHGSDDTERNLFDGLEGLSAGAFVAATDIEEDGLGVDWRPESAINARIDLDLESWAPRCA